MTLLHQSYFDKHLKLVVHASSKENGEANSLLRLNAVNDGQLPISMYTELDINVLRLKGFLITKDPNCILDENIRPQCPE